jgi:hypothetical protein
MATFRRSRIIPVALVLIIIAIAIAALVSLARAVFFSGDTQKTTQVDVSRDALLSTTANRSVRITVRGAIVADEQFHSYQITISPSSRILTTYIGYLDTHVDQVLLPNNIPAYEEFVYALDRASLVKGIELTGDKNDTRGICASGLVYQFDVLQDTKTVKSLWTTTCKSVTGSLSASVDQLKKLFIDQIPNATTLIGKIHL